MEVDEWKRRISGKDFDINTRKWTENPRETAPLMKMKGC